MRSAAILVVGLLMIHYSVKDVAFSVCVSYDYEKKTATVRSFITSYICTRVGRGRI